MRCPGDEPEENIFHPKSIFIPKIHLNCKKIFLHKKIYFRLRPVRPGARAGSRPCALAAGSGSQTSITSAPWRRSGTPPASSVQSAGQSWKMRHLALKRMAKYTAEKITRGKYFNYSALHRKNKIRKICEFHLVHIPLFLDLGIGLRLRLVKYNRGLS